MRHRALVGMMAALVIALGVTAWVSFSRAAEAKPGDAAGWEYAVLTLCVVMDEGAIAYWDPRPHRDLVTVEKDEREEARQGLYEEIGGRGKECSTAIFYNLLSSKGWEFVEVSQTFGMWQAVFRRRGK